MASSSLSAFGWHDAATVGASRSLSASCTALWHSPNHPGCRHICHHIHTCCTLYQLMQHAPALVVTSVSGPLYHPGPWFKGPRQKPSFTCSLPTSRSCYGFYCCAPACPTPTDKHDAAFVHLPRTRLTSPVRPAKAGTSAAVSGFTSSKLMCNCCRCCAASCAQMCDADVVAAWWQ
jgi:hypothetical protein